MCNFTYFGDRFPPLPTLSLSLSRFPSTLLPRTTPSPSLLARSSLRRYTATHGLWREKGTRHADSLQDAAPPSSPQPRDQQQELESCALFVQDHPRGLHRVSDVANREPPHHGTHARHGVSVTTGGSLRITSTTTNTTPHLTEQDSLSPIPPLIPLSASK